MNNCEQLSSTQEVTPSKNRPTSARRLIDIFSVGDLFLIALIIGLLLPLVALGLDWFLEKVRIPITAQANVTIEQNYNL